MSHVRMIGTPLDKELLDEFETVQQFHGIKTSADVVRFLIRQEYRTIADRSLLMEVNAPADNGDQESP